VEHLTPGGSPLSSIPTPHIARARVGVLARYAPDDKEAMVEARRDLAAANIAQTIGQQLAKSAPLTDEQVTEIVGILRGGAR